MKEKLRKGLKAVLCSMAAFMLCMMCSVTSYAGTGAELPHAQLTPDGQAWTIVDALPQEDYSKGPASFWVEEGKELEVGEQDLVSDYLAEGEHIYKYKRTGLVPIYKWQVVWKPAECIHWNTTMDYHGMEISTFDICGKNYWSGWIPYCANCGDVIAENHHYIKPSSVAQIDTYDMDMTYYYLCPHNGNLEQGADKPTHMCDAISANRYMVVYMPNCGEYVGEMDNSYHMYCNATHFEGEEIVPNKYLYKNNYTREGYTFKGWALTPDGEVVYEDQAEIYNLTDENYDKDAGTGIVYLYAVWERSVSTLIVDANGGTYEDTKGVWDAENTTRTYADINYGAKITLIEGNLTPPDGYDVVFDEQGGTPVDDVTAPKKFISWEMSEPFGGRFLDEVYHFVGPDGTVDTLTAIYGNGSIILPATEKEGSSFGGWYEGICISCKKGCRGI